MKQEPFVMGGPQPKHCPLNVINAKSTADNVYRDCHYTSVCPTPCTPMHRLSMQIDAEREAKR